MKGTEKIKCWNFIAICGNLSEWVSGKQSSLNLSIFPAFQFGPRIRTEGPNSSSQQIVGGSFLVPYCLGLLLPFPLRPNQVPHVVGLIFSKK